MTIWRWADRFEQVPEASRLTLGEGETPLVRSRRLGRDLGLPNLWFKLEHGNATGSYKDRFACVAISDMLARGKSKCLATSSGNTGAALAAYCAAAGIECRIAIVEGAPLGKLTQMMAYGARIARIRKFGVDAATTDQIFQTLQRLGSAADAAMQVSAFVYSPVGMSGVQSIAFEIAEQLPSVAAVFCPAGGGGLCVAAARGFQQLVGEGVLAAAPAVHCVQPEGNDTISGPLRGGSNQARDVDCTTRISGLQVASVVDGHLAIESCRETGGTGYVVRDEDVWEAQKRLARDEGIFTEPAGAVALAGAVRAAELGELPPERDVVCLVTGSGFKDASAVDRINSDIECPMIDAEDVANW